MSTCTAPSSACTALAPSAERYEARIWEGIRIWRRTTDGYVNATRMCQANGRHLPHYVALARSAQYLEALSRSVGIPTDLLRVKVMTGPNHLRGTWVHPRLAVDLARWISPEFAVWMDSWFLAATAKPQPLLQPEPPRYFLFSWDTASPYERHAALLFHGVQALATLTGAEHRRMRSVLSVSSRNLAELLGSGPVLPRL